MAVVKLTNPHNREQGVVFRYCEVPEYIKRAVCIIESRPIMRRYLFTRDLEPQSLALFIEDWQEGNLKPHLKVESIYEEREGRVQVSLNNK